MPQEKLSYTVVQEAASPADYAETELVECSIPLREELFACANLYRYGEKPMVRALAISTEYGILLALGGRTVEQRPGRESPVQGMKFGR